MQRRHFLTTTVAVLHGFALGGLRAGAQVIGRASGTPIALGAYISGAPDNPALLDQFTNLVGSTPAVVMWFQDWVHGEFDPIRMNAVASRNAMPMVTWEPWDYTNGTNQPAYTLATIATGVYDGFVQKWARDAARWGRPFYLRFAHEMNGDWYPWGIGVNGNTAAQYIAAWKHVVNIFRNAGATNVRWVWCPNIGGTNNGTSTGSSAVSYNAIYPGDMHVDWVALDGYNWGTTQSWSDWQEIGIVFGSSYTALSALTAKPMMIAETASAEQGGNKANWIASGLTTIPTQFPRVRAVIWFNEQKETDWRVNSSPASLAAYRGVAQSALYQGKLT